MSVGSADLVVYKSASGSSDGGAASATAVTSGVKNNLWPDISDALRASGGSRIKKWFLKNEHATDALVKPAVWQSVVPAGVTEDLGLGVDSSDDSDNAMGTLAAWSANAKVSLTSSAADTRSATIYGVDSGGIPVSEVVVLTGAVEVLSVTTYSKVWSVWLSAIDATKTVTIKQGSGGTTRGSIGVNKKAIWLWVTAVSQGTGIALTDLPAMTTYGFWDRQTWPAATAAVRPARQTVALVET